MKTFKQYLLTERYDQIQNAGLLNEETRPKTIEEFHELLRKLEEEGKIELYRILGKGAFAETVHDDMAYIQSKTSGGKTYVLKFSNNPRNTAYDGYPFWAELSMTKKGHAFYPPVEAIFPFYRAIKDDNGITIGYDEPSDYEYGFYAILEYLEFPVYDETNVGLSKFFSYLNLFGERDNKTALMNYALVKDGKDNLYKLGDLFENSQVYGRHGRNINSVTINTLENFIDNKINFFLHICEHYILESGFYGQDMHVIYLKSNLKIKGIDHYDYLDINGEDYAIIERLYLDNSFLDELFQNVDGLKYALEDISDLYNKGGWRVDLHPRNYAVDKRGNLYFTDPLGFND